MSIDRSRVIFSRLSAADVTHSRHVFGEELTDTAASQFPKHCTYGTRRKKRKTEVEPGSFDVVPVREISPPASVIALSGATPSREK